MKTAAEPGMSRGHVRAATTELTTLDGGLVERAEPEPTGAEACVVCGGASADLICQACRALISEAAFVTR